MTPLMSAVESGNLKAVALCLNNSCSPFYKNMFCETAHDLAKKFPFHGESINMQYLIETAIEQWIA